MKQIWQFLNSFNKHKPLLCLCIVLKLAFSFVALGMPEVMRLSMDAITYKSLSQLKTAGVIAIIVTVLYIALEAVIEIMEKDISNKYEESAQVFMFEKVAAIKKIRLSSFKSGEIVTQVMNNAKDGTSGSLRAVFSMTSGLSVIVLGVLYMGITQWKIALVIILYNVAMRAAMKFLEKLVKANSKKAISIAKSNNSFLFDILANMMVVRVFGKADWFLAKLNEMESNTLKIKTVGYAWRNGMNDGTWAAIKLAEYFVLYGFGGYLVYTNQTTLGVLLAFTMAIDMFTKGLDRYSWALVDKNRAIACIESMEEITNIGETENEPHITIAGDDFMISFDDVSFKYGDRMILDKISFKIAPNEKILIKGPNGQGKSTLLNLVSGLLRPDTGVIKYGDYDIKMTNLDEIAKKYTYISQNSNILQGDVYQNIALSLDYNKALCDEVISKLNLEKTVDTAPQSLSQGEKQRLNIGRSIYRFNKSNIVIGDEIFSNIDKENVKNIMTALSRELENRTVIMICHEDIDFKFDRVFHVEGTTVKITDATGVKIK